MDEMAMGESGLIRATEVFKAIAHPARLRIVGALRAGELCVCQITAVLELAASTVSAHLADLRRAGLLVERKDGRWVSYRLARQPGAAAILGQVWTLIAGDPQVDADARLVRDLRRVPVEKLCRMDLDVTRLGLKRPVAR